MNDSGPWNNYSPPSDSAGPWDSYQPDIGKLESFGRGAANNFPLAPQAIAAMEPGGYSKNLTDWNSKAQAAKSANPITYGAGAVTGALAPLAIPGVGEALESAPILGNAALGAAGAISNTDLTKDPLGTLKQAGIGAAIGGATAGAMQKFLPGEQGLTNLANKKALQSVEMPSGIVGAMTPEERTSLGDFLQKNNLVGADKTKVLEQARSLSKQFGEKIGEIGDTAQGNIVPKELPVIDPGSTSGNAHALFAYNDQFTPDMAPESKYQVWGDPSDPAFTGGGGKLTHGSQATAAQLEEAGVPITGRTPRSVGKWEPVSAPGATPLTVDPSDHYKAINGLLDKGQQYQGLANKTAKGLARDYKAGANDILNLPDNPTWKDIQQLKEQYGNLAFDSKGEVKSEGTKDTYFALKDMLKGIADKAQDNPTLGADYKQALAGYSRMQPIESGLEKTVDSQLRGGGAGMGARGLVGLIKKMPGPVRAVAGPAAVAMGHPVIGLAAALPELMNPALQSKAATAMAPLMPGIKQGATQEFGDYLESKYGKR